VKCLKDETIRKYVKNMDGLLEEMSEVQAIPAVRIDEKAVTFLSDRIFRFLNFDDIIVGHEKADDLDALAFNDREMQDTIIEFEAKSRHFKRHKHDPKKCNLIVCWEDDWKECPIDVLELRYFWEKTQEKFCKK